MGVIAVLLAILMTGQRATPPASAAVTGVVQDQTGAILAGATVELIDTAGHPVETVQTDAVGLFRFERVPAGTYQLRATFEGFTPATTRVRVGTRAPSTQTLVLSIASLTQEITVRTGSVEVSTAPTNNADAVSLDAATLDSLPVFDRDYVSTLSRFLDTDALGNAGVTVVVNGMEVSAVNVSASAISQIRVNQDPYSAEYSRPGRGRIEILTKAGSQQFTGEVNALFRDSTFNARNALADVKPPEQRRITEGFWGGPLGSSGRTSFMLSANDERDDNQAIIYAIAPGGTIRDTLPQPSARSLVTASITHQAGPSNTWSVRPTYQYESDENRGAGGTTLASAATTFRHNEQQVTYTQQTVVNPSLVNQFQILLGHEREPTTSRSEDPAIVVAGAFTGGGGQGDLVRTETHINLNESVSWLHGSHQVQAGFQLPDWSRRGFYDRTNFGGTFFFASLDAYAAGTPYAFTQQQGNGDIAFLEKQVGLYAKDDWRLREGLSVAYGLRYDWQNYFHDDNNVAPRIAVAYSVGKRDVIRVGLGVFNDRSGPVVIADVLRSQPGGLIRYVLTNPSYPNPFDGPAQGITPPPSVVQLAPDVQIPRTLQYSVALDHQLQKNTALSITYTGARGYHLFRSRDVNAPPPPLYLARPNPAYGSIREVESNGRQHSESVSTTLRGRMTALFTGQVQYTWSRVYNDTSGIAAYPANDYDLASEWSRADFDRRHRFLVLGRTAAMKVVDVGLGVTLMSGTPYSELLGQDVYNNGRGRARPLGVPRNSLEGAGSSAVDLRVSRDIAWGVGGNRRAMTLGLDAFNLLNHVNYTTYVGTIDSPFFGRPVAAQAGRQIQFSARIKF
jgi:hypothetical protein